MAQNKNISLDSVIEDVLQENFRLVTELEKVRQSLSKYKQRELDSFTIGNAVSDGICVVDKDGLVIAINKGYTKITGLKDTEIVGKHIQDLVVKKYFNNAVSLMVIEQKKKVSALSTILTNNKKVLITGNPFFDEKGNVTQVLTVMRDMTELLQLKNRLEEAEIENKMYQDQLGLIKKRKSNLIGNSHEMEMIKKQIESVAVTDATVLITGETGSGKEVVAEEIVRFSNRNDKPYIKVNCAAIPEPLLESELFGYEKGAFTGAGNKDKLGLFEMANTGTILLDEIGEMPMVLQSKLLRVLQERELVRVGGTQPIKLDVRVLAATNQDLMKLIETGVFREDLYYRLNVIPIRIPPVRERKDDITILAYKFLEEFNNKYSKETEFENGALQVIESYGWPGNVRELMNVIERLIIMETGDRISPESIEKVLGMKKTDFQYIDTAEISYRQAMDSFEKGLIEKSLKKHGSTHKAALELGISQPTVVRKAKALGIKNW
ncbi:sigma 54-interacting transcriptional regulator [Alkalibacter sp. M17DMB]|nr:sigma 54-interacting transcriptional regulator [Alkalibacter mobilis]